MLHAIGLNIRYSISCTKSIKKKSDDFYPHNCFAVNTKLYLLFKYVWEDYLYTYIKKKKSPNPSLWPDFFQGIMVDQVLIRTTCALRFKLFLAECFSRKFYKIFIYILLCKYLSAPPPPYCGDHDLNNLKSTLHDDALVTPNFKLFWPNAFIGRF